MNADAADMYHRVRALALGKYRATKDDAHDAASFAVTKAIENAAMSFPFCATVTRNYFFEKWRNRRARQEVGGFDFSIDGDVDERLSTQPPIQDLHLMAAECARAIDELPPIIRSVMLLVAREYSADEIANELHLKLGSVRNHMREGRAILRRREGYELGRRNRYRFTGIQREGRKWYAQVRHGDLRIKLGGFDSASDAAKAYDAKAKELFGASAKLNFPNETELPRASTP
jgi:DNA-directed RNA polymerase specialized sigma24 family protein